MSNVVPLRPLVLGYARLSPFAGRSQHTAVQAQLSSWANKAGVQLGTIYIEHTGSPPHFAHDNDAPAFTELAAAIERSGASGVVVPSLDAFGNHPDARISELQNDLGVDLHVVSVHDPATDSRPRTAGQGRGPLRRALSRSSATSTRRLR